MKLAELVAQHATTDGVHTTAIPRLDLIRLSQPTGPVQAMHEPALCIVAQGTKQVVLGGKVYENGSEKFLIVSLDLPVIGQVTEATAERPYLCVRLNLDRKVLGALLLDAQWDEKEEEREVKASHYLGLVTPELLEATSRLVSLLGGSPRDIRILAPLAEREILYRLLTSGQGKCLRLIARADSKLSQVHRAIAIIKRNYDKSLRVDDIAREARMSSSALHQHFRAATSMSPLQYQKRIRLQEARRLIFMHALDAATAGHRVGYESPSQFSREYRRLFGNPPGRDAKSSGVAGGMHVQ
jgi:AraC-like DNA-binding protein